MTNSEQQQVIGLAATVQALSVVQAVAMKGQFNKDATLPLFYSLINYNPDSALLAYNSDLHALRYGFEQLKKLFTDALDKDLTQYIFAVVTIERKLVIQAKMRSILQTELRDLKRTLEHSDKHPGYHQVFDSDFDDEDGDGQPAERASLADVLTSHEMIERFANIYKQTASNTEPRIMVKGNHQFLQSETSANQIRALLLAALRGAAFFRHYGGKRIDFMLKRKQYLAVVEQLY